MLLRKISGGRWRPCQPTNDIADGVTGPSLCAQRRCNAVSALRHHGKGNVDPVSLLSLSLSPLSRTHTRSFTFLSFFRWRCKSPSPSPTPLSPLQRVDQYLGRKRAEMRLFHTAILLSYIAASATAWIATVTEWVTLDPSTASRAVQTPSDVRIEAFSESTTSASPTVLATTTTSPTLSDIASETPSSTPSSIASRPTSGLLQATSQSAQPLPIATTASAPEYGDYNAGSPGSGSEIDSDAGASGSSSSFSLSRGGMIAVIVVVAVVAIFGSKCLLVCRLFLFSYSSHDSVIFKWPS